MKWTFDNSNDAFDIIFHLDGGVELVARSFNREPKSDVRSETMLMFTPGDRKSLAAFLRACADVLDQPP